MEERLRLAVSHPEALAEAADANLVAHMSWIQQRTPGMQAQLESDLVVIDSGLPCDTFNIVCRARLCAERAEARIATTFAFFRERQHPFCWWVGPSDRPAWLCAALQAAGLTGAESEEAMAADLEVLHAVAPHLPELQIVRVQTPDQLHDFAMVVAANWNPPDTNILRFYMAAGPAALAPDSPLRFYVGYWEGEPVATCEVTLANGVAGLYNICTLEAYRRRGIGSGMTREALEAARAEGYRTAILQASAEGGRVYSRFGFTTWGRYIEFKPA